MTEKTNYATWIRKKKMIIFWLLFASLLIVGLVGGILYWPFFALSLLSLPFLYIAFIVTRTALLFSPRGGDYQNKIHELVISHISKTDPVLDIGCGSGHLITKIAKLNPSLHQGIDYWGEDWEYSKSQCEKNARLEGLNSIVFTKASASRLPFDSNSIGTVVSCLTFHEVNDLIDKTLSLAEALRVLKSGGSFVFFDLFGDKNFYPESYKIAQAIDMAGGKIKVRQKLSEIMNLPFPLNTDKVLKHAEIIVGKKL